MRKPPRQKPGQSNQDVGTPPEFIQAACQKLHIKEFNWDLAAEASNSVCGQRFYSKEMDSFKQDWARPEHFRNWSGALWNWLNPPFAHIYPWAEKCFQESLRGAYTALLVPAATDTEWWKDYVHGHGYALLARPRITFIGHTQGYPKGLALVLYTPQGFYGYDLWNWKAELKAP